MGLNAGWRAKPFPLMTRYYVITFKCSWRAKPFPLMTRYYVITFKCRLACKTFSTDDSLLRWRLPLRPPDPGPYTIILAHGMFAIYVIPRTLYDS